MATQVTIGGKVYNYRFDLGSMMAYERIETEFCKKLNIEALTGSLRGIVTHYSCLLADEAFAMTIDEFAAAINTAEALESLTKAQAHEMARWQGCNGAIITEEASDSEKKK